MKNLRADIITRYRDRIATGERTKLSQDDLHRLIATFVEQLQGLTTQDDIKALCEAEIQLLEEGYPQATIAKVYLPLYRKAIQVAAAEGKLPMTATTSRQYLYTKSNTGKTEAAHDHRALDFLKYDKATYGAIAGKSAERNNQKQDHLKPVNPDVYLAKAAALLQSEDPFELAVGIAATTGRRFSEVLDKGTLLATDHPDWVSFSGQLKKTSKTESYLTPCLLPAADVLAALARFRNHPRIARVAGGTARDLNRSLANSVKRAVHRHFSDIIPVLQGEKDVTIHNLRGVYGEIAVHYFCPPSRGVARFVQERLGHVISDEELQRSNSTATQHYFHYYLVDGNGKHIGSRGVKLTEGESLPTPIELTSESQSETVSESLPETQPTQLPEFINAIATLTQQMQALTQDNQRIWQYLNTMNTSPTQAPTATDTSFFTREIENLRSQLTTLEQERNHVAAALEQARTKHDSSQQQFAQERLSYQQRIEVLTELLKQPPSAAQTQPSVNPVQPTQPLKREHPTRAGRADQRVEAAMWAIMEWNRQEGRDWEDKFAITQSLLQKSTGSNMPAVKRVMEMFKNEIYEHNSQYALDPVRHNYGRDFEEIKTFVQSNL
jgi:integrase